MKFIALLLITACSSVPILSDRMEDTCSFSALELYEQENRNSASPSPTVQDSTDLALDTITPKVQYCYKQYLQSSYDKRVIPACLVAKIDSENKTVFYDFSSRKAQLPKTLIQCLNSTRNDEAWESVGPVTFYQNFYLRP